MASDETDSVSTDNAAGLNDLAGHLLRLASNQAQLIFREHFKAFDVSSLQYCAFAVISGRPGIFHGELAGQLGTSKTVVTTLLKPMLEAGDVVTSKGQPDLRQTGYLLSPEGQRKFERLKTEIAKTETDLLAVLSPQEAAELMALLKKLARVDDPPGTP